ncbi:MAG: adenylosuccinate synthase [Planctomycetota bacterium]
MVAICVVGAQWGDEGKGKIIDLLAEEADVVIRFAGGNNAGHTVVIEDRRFALHLLPSGILRPGKLNVIASGVVVDPWHLSDEVRSLRSQGIRISMGENLLVSRSAHLVLPYHPMQDRLWEELRGKGKIGTTGRGIGPAYQDRASRSGLRFGDLLDRDWLERRLRAVVVEKNELLGTHGQSIDADKLLPLLRDLGEELGPAACDSGLLLRKWIEDGRDLLFEGAQGLMLDVDLGTYPYVTSSSVGIGGIGSSGVSPRAIGKVYLVAKAYSTRVGEGPLPTELHGEEGERLRVRGQEYGTTTGRPRRCGWLDAVALRYAVQVSGADALMLTNLDVLSSLSSVRVGVMYEVDGEMMPVFPSGVSNLERVRVHYHELEGWAEDLAFCRSFEDLPAGARNYVTFLEKTLRIEIPLISVGPERGQVVRRD